VTTEKLEPISKDKYIYVSDKHKFSTDTILLADFSMPKAGAICADLGTGCGMIPLLWCIRSKMQKAYGIEIQEDGANMARKSVKLNGFDEKLEIICGDIRNIKNDSLRDIDIISCNPPYKPLGTGIRCSDEVRDTARHEFSCTIDDVCAAANKMLRYGGKLCICHRPERLCDIMYTFRNNGIEPKRLRFVQQRDEKQPFLFLLEGRKGGKPYLNCEPVLFIEKDGTYSKKMLEIYGDYKPAPKEKQENQYE
jgi:tRNA1Val (adenine37-N6)-methyltransferase